MPANRATPAGLEYGPTANGKMYLSVYKHRGDGSRRHKNFWLANILPDMEYGIFCSSDDNDWHDEELNYWGVLDLGRTVLGEKGERICKFPCTSNDQDPCAIDKLESEPIQITTDYVHPIEWDLKITADVLLDLNIYNGRAYIGTNKGLYHLELDWEAESITPIAKAQKRLDAKCVHTTAKYGTVNASCGSEGWFSFLDDFELGTSNTRKEKHVPEYSLRTNWLDFDIVNYPTITSPTLFSSVRTASSQALSESKNNFNLEQESWIVTDLEDEEVSLDSLFDNLNHGFSLENLQFVHNSSQALFLSTYDGYLFALGLKRGSCSAPTVSYVSKFEGLRGLVSSLHTVSAGGRAGLVLETDEQILLFARRRFIPLFHDEVISIRTFSRSQHYRNVVSITTSDEVILIAIFDDEA